MNDKELYFCLMIGCIFLMPIITYSQFNMAKQLIEYAQHGTYHYDCMLYYFPTFTQYDFTICESNNIVGLVLSFGITVTIFLIMAIHVFRFISKSLKRENKIEVS